MFGLSEMDDGRSFSMLPPAGVGAHCAKTAAAAVPPVVRRNVRRVGFVGPEVCSSGIEPPLEEIRLLRHIVAADRGLDTGEPENSFRKSFGSRTRPADSGRIGPFSLNRLVNIPTETLVTILVRNNRTPAAHIMGGHPA
jgi:hypothetical protein